MFSDIKEFLSSFWKKIHSKKLIKRFLGLIIICLLTVLIPISIAICYTQFLKAEEKNTIPNVTVSLFNVDGNLIKTETAQENDINAHTFTNIFYNIHSSKISTSKPDEFSKEPNFNLKVTYNSSVTTLKCYFEEDANSSYLEDQYGNFYLPEKVAYSMFLKSNYAETVYKESSPPTLSTPLGDEILANKAQWTYTLNDGNEKKSENYEITQKLLTYRIAGAITFDFSRTPDICNITVKDLNGTIIFSGSPEKLTSLTAEENTELLVTVDAKWQKNDLTASYGEQSYEFKIICSDPSTFNLSTTEAHGGQFILLSVSDVDDVDSIIYSPTLTLSEDIKAKDDNESNALKQLYSYKPIFAKKGSDAYAFLPIPAHIPDTTFTFSISCGISKSELTINLKKSTFENILVDNIALTKAQKAEFSRRIFHLKHSKSDLLLINSDFLLPSNYDFAQTYKFNSNVNNSFDLLANTYSAKNSNGISVLSANVGTVSDIGTSPLLGNYVIVDHGMGLLTWYCGLSDISVKENDIVKKGDPIGRTGSSSLLCENGVNIICSIGGILIDPDEFVSKQND
ncbi:MAG: M23 family metallopeptidase [Ruminococcaceae bacterium]|nr:M23 family metallopeptidase [Oscillospiraceae bacterium]